MSTATARRGTEQRTPPYDLDAEEALLGAMLLTPEAIEAAAETGLSSAAFYKPAHGHIYDAVQRLHGAGQPADPVTVADELRRSGELDAAGGPAVLVTLQSRTPSTSNAHSYAAVVVEHHEARRLIGMLSAATEDAYIGRRPAEVAESVRAGLLTVAPAPAVHQAAVDGASFVLDTPEQLDAVWGDGARVAWQRGESLFLCGPAGVGKTTLAQQVALARCGLRPDVLGMPVAPTESRVLYLAADRPQQAARSLRRMVSDEDRPMLSERLLVWPGPLPFDLAADPDRLAVFVADHRADTVIVDSLKDVALDLAKDDAGSRVSRALQVLVAAGVDVLVLHHQRKGQDGRKPRKLEDVYGSTWLTAGAGSVLLLWGEPGDLVVDLDHLKQPAEPVGPLKLEHDHARGTSTVHRGFDPLTALRAAPGGLTAVDVARLLFEKAKPNDNERKKAKRTLDRLVRDDLATVQKGPQGGAGGSAADRYYAIDDRREAP